MDWRPWGRTCNKAKIARILPCLEHRKSGIKDVFRRPLAAPCDSFELQLRAGVIRSYPEDGSEKGTSKSVGANDGKAKRGRG